MSNRIFVNQNKPDQQQLIVTQHYVYKNAKRFTFFLLILSVFIPIVFNITLIWIKNEMITTIFSFVSICLVISSEIIRAFISEKKSTAAQIQQKFDIDVYELDNMYCLNDEKVYIAVDKYKNKNLKRKKNWYHDYSKLDKNIAIFYCQKENIDWTNNLTTKYIKFLIFVVGIMFVVITLNFIIADNSMSDIIALFIIALPLLTYCFSGCVKVHNDNKSLNEIKEYANKIEVLIEENGTVDIKMVKNLQWMIFYYRKNKHLIPDWFDKVFYKNIASVEKSKASKRNKKE